MYQIIVPAASSFSSLPLPRNVFLPPRPSLLSFILILCLSKMTSNECGDKKAGAPGSGSKAAEIYADIAFDYNAAKSNPFKRYVEEPTFAAAVLASSCSSSGIYPSSSSCSLSGQHVLDLGCGSGYYCRILKNEIGAEVVRGVDVSEHMLAEAKRQEAENPLGIKFLCQDLLDPLAATKIKEAFGAPDQMDLVTAEYLMPYAASREELNQLCANAASLVKPGGRFCSIVSMCTDSIMSATDGILESSNLGWASTWEGDAHDGMVVDMTLFGEGRSSRVSFPNVLWTQKTIKAAMKLAGFTKVVWVPVMAGDNAPDAVKKAPQDINKTPIGVFVASM